VTSSVNAPDDTNLSDANVSVSLTFELMTLKMLSVSREPGSE